MPHALKKQCLLGNVMQCYHHWRGKTKRHQICKNFYITYSKPKEISQKGPIQEINVI